MNDSQRLVFRNAFHRHRQVLFGDGETTRRISDPPPCFLSSAVRSNVLHKQWRAAKATQCPCFCRDSARVMLSGRGRKEGSGRVGPYV